MKKLIVYIGSFVFPYGDAVARRVYGTSLALKSAGYEMAIIGESSDVPIGHMSQEKECETFLLCNIHKPSGAGEHYVYLQDVKLIKSQLKEWAKRYDIAAVFFCGMKCALLANAVVDVCKRLNITVIADSMDWLEIHTGNPLFDVVKRLDISFELRYVNKKADAVMAISSYLAEYYRNKGLKTIVVPPLSPYSKTEETASVSEIPTIIYAGTPCRLNRPLTDLSTAKDRLDVAIELMHQLNIDDVKFRFCIYGMTADEYLTAFPQQKNIVNELVSDRKVIFYGRVMSDVAKDAVMQADYTLLLRDRNRTSMAGFPSKIAESIALGTPVITTDTSDIFHYLHDGKDAVLLDLADRNVAFQKLRQALLLSLEERMRAKEHARSNTAFSPKTYSDLLQGFLNVI